MTRRLPLSTDGVEALGRFSRIRLVAIDIDGTLLAHPSSEVAEVIAGLRRSLAHYRRSVVLTIATGRAYAGAQPVLERLELPKKTPVILYNGAVTCAADGTSFVRLFSVDCASVRIVVELALAARMTPLVYDPKLWFGLADRSLPTPPPIAERVIGFAAVAPNLPREFNGLEVEWRTSSADVPTSAAAIVIPTPHGPSCELVAALSANPGVTVTSSSNAYLEVRPFGANKGAALSLLASECSLQPEQVLAIGDNDNDVEMLKWAGCSVAVANSTHQAIAASDYLADGPAGEGVVETLRLLYDARRHRLRL